MQRRYVDIAVDAAAATADKPPAERFYWTAETTVPIADSLGADPQAIINPSCKESPIFMERLDKP
jgi:hypothetical protein